MKVPVTYLLPGAVLLGFGVYTAITLSHTPPVHAVTHHAAANIQRGDGLPPAPPANAPLTRWIIGISAPSGKRRSILLLWNALGRPPLLWSPFEKYYYLSVGNRGDVLRFTYIQHSPSWYGKPLKP